MLGLGSYVAVGVAVLLAFEYAAPASATLTYRPIPGLSDAPTAVSVVSRTSLQVVNRARKANRLDDTIGRVRSPGPAAIERMKHKNNIAPRPVPRVPVGCDAAFSNLAGFAQQNFASRCLA